MKVSNDCLMVQENVQVIHLRPGLFGEKQRPHAEDWQSAGRNSINTKTIGNRKINCAWGGSGW